MENTGQNPTVSKFPLLILGVVIVSNLLGFGLIYHRLTVPQSTPQDPSSTSPSTSTDNSITTRLAQVESDLAALRSESRLLKQVLGTSTSTDTSLSSTLPDISLAATQSITISDPKFPTIEVFELPLASSKVVSRLDFGKSYPFTSRQGEWYHLQLPDGLFGWVNAQLVKPTL
jgi:hypothetical protein